MPLGNTVGSLTSRQHAVLVGSLLGDGTLRKQGTRTNALFEVNHSFEFREYVDWRWQQFREYVPTPPKARKGNGKRIAYQTEGTRKMKEIIAPFILPCFQYKLM